MIRFAILISLFVALHGHSAQADELRPGYLELRETAPDTYSLLFKIPALGDDRRLAIYVDLPDGTHDAAPPRSAFSRGAYTERRTIRRAGGMAGQVVSIEGLSATSADVLVTARAIVPHSTDVESGLEAGCESQMLWPDFSFGRS